MGELVCERCCRYNNNPFDPYNRFRCQIDATNGSPSTGTYICLVVLSRRLFCRIFLRMATTPVFTILLVQRSFFFDNKFLFHPCLAEAWGKNIYRSSRKQEDNKSTLRLLHPLYAHAF